MKTCTFPEENTKIQNEELKALLREHTILLNRKRVNKGMKRTNILPLSPVIHERPYCRENPY